MRADEVLPATRFIGNEYLNLVRTRPFLECVASSLTELFSRDLITLRMEKLRQHYPWLASALDYFEARLTEAPEDAAFAIQYVFDHAATRAEQERVIQALRDKCDILWAQLDALYFAYVEPGWPPPGAFRIEGTNAWLSLTDASVPKFAAGMPLGRNHRRAGRAFSGRRDPRGRNGPHHSRTLRRTFLARLKLCRSWKRSSCWRRRTRSAPMSRRFWSNCTPSASSIIEARLSH